MYILENKRLDLTFLKETLVSADEMSLVNPTANFPFEEEYWQNFFKLKNTETYSIYLFEEDEIIGHAALQKNDVLEGMIHLCFFVLAKKARGKGNAQKFLALVEEFLLQKFKTNEYYLNVLKTNEKAIQCYHRFGFIDFLEQENRIKMIKRFD